MVLTSKILPRFGSGIDKASTVDQVNLFTVNVPEVSAKHHGLTLIADNVQVGDAILPHVGMQFRNCC